MNVIDHKYCRVCGNEELKTILDLGQMELTGVFPKSKDEKLTEGPLRLVLCPKCGLVQLAHSYPLEEMYGMNYGYRSGLNASMVAHLQQKVAWLEKQYPMNRGDIVVDIGSNDGTTLNSYSTPGLRKIGIDPTAKKFYPYYHDDVELVPEFFSAEAYRRISDKPAKLVTSISMFYDLENPVDFASQVESILAEDGIWHLEQNYLLSMLRNNAYDIVGHEHLEYYSLHTIKFILESVGLRIIDASTNDINGGSFAVTAAKKNSVHRANEAVINWMLAQEEASGLLTEGPYLAFGEKCYQHRDEFVHLLDALRAEGKKVYAYGASTRGNTILEFCGITDRQILAIAEVNPDKFGAFTPKTHIPILSEDQIKEYAPDYMVVLPWHYRNMILNKEKQFLQSGGKLIFPLPYVEIV